MSPTPSKNHAHLSVARPAAVEAPIAVARTIREVKPYLATSSLEAIHGRPDQVPLKLDWNESTVPPSPKVISAITAFLGQEHHLNWYPVLNSTNLIEKLERFHGLSGDRLLITNGSDDALDTICTTYLDPGDTVLVPSPTYTHFLVFAQKRSANIVPVYGEDAFGPNLEGIIDAAVRLRPRLLYLVNPNNPTGVIYSPDEVSAIAAACPETLVICDEAYSEFAGVSAIGLLEAHPNLIITRTFSKAYGIAGLRIGYAMGAPEVIRDLRRVFNPKSVNVLAQIGAMAALEDQEYLNWYLGEVKASKALIEAYFQRRALDCRITPANYFLVHFDQAPWVVKRLQEEGVYVRDRSGLNQLAGYVRFSIGTTDQTRDLLKRLDQILDR
ncbi:MAG: histidinol-phosphate aminotransferase family protein [Myxococcales bacterium]|nr:histidinol-phosphate aminotransferase family protein [Myxococcales bacterium]